MTWVNITFILIRNFYWAVQNSWFSYWTLQVPTFSLKIFWAQFSSKNWPLLKCLCPSLYLSILLSANFMLMRCGQGRSSEWFGSFGRWLKVFEDIGHHGWLTKKILGSGTAKIVNLGRFPIRFDVLQRVFFFAAELFSLT